MSELIRDFRYRVRSWRDVWAWFTYGSGMRLFALAVIAIYLAIEYGS